MSLYIGDPYQARSFCALSIEVSIEVQCSMASFLLSKPEIDYIVDGVNSNYRADGRTCKDYRHFNIQTGVVSNTSGSAKIQLVKGQQNKMLILVHTLSPYTGSYSCCSGCEG